MSTLCSDGIEEIRYSYCATMNDIIVQYVCTFDCETDVIVC